MYTTIRPFLALCLLSTLNLQLSTPSRAQGSLTPPAGPPAPVMRSLTEIYDKTAAVETQNTAQNTQLANIQTTLGQVQVRTAVNTLPGDATATHVILSPGSYYFTGSIIGVSGKVGIRVEAANVIIDLNGFNLQAAAGATKGIQVGASAGGPVVIRNGFLRFWQEQAIHMPNTTEFTLQDLTISNVTGRGIEVAGSGTIERVVVRWATEFGIHCTASPQAIIRDCRVENISHTGRAVGIYAPNSLISGCAVSNVSGTNSGQGVSISGISSLSGSVRSCIVRNVTQSGAGYAAGIELADKVEDCRVFEVVGNSGGTSAFVVGISDSENVIGCTVKTINGQSNHTAMGIGGCQRVSHCRVSQITGTQTTFGIRCDDVSDSFVENLPNGSGLFTSRASLNTVKNCRTGIVVVGSGAGGSGCSAVGNTVLDGNLYGIDIAAVQASVTDNTVLGLLQAGSSGITASNYAVKIERNHVGNWALGISASGVSPLVIRNTAASNTTNYNIHTNMSVVTLSALGTNPNANISQ